MRLALAITNVLLAAALLLVLWWMLSEPDDDEPPRPASTVDQWRANRDRVQKRRTS